MALQSKNPEFVKDKLNRLMKPVQQGVKPISPENIKVSLDGDDITKNFLGEEAEYSDLQQAYDKVYNLTDKMGDEALEQMNRYAPQFSDALEKHGDIESIEQNDSANVQDYIKELDYVLFQLGESINEAEYNGKKVKLNKPMRQSGGGKKYKVYVKNPKTGRVKKISFGDAGLKTKSGNKKRAKSFAARHNCEKKNDKMKAGYWACRLPRYGLVKGGKWW